MSLMPITHTSKTNSHPKFGSKLKHLNSLLDELRQRELPGTSEVYINGLIIDLNKKDGSDPKLHKQLCQLQQRILKHLEKQLKWVPKGYYQSQWTAIGMAVFGMTFGVVFATALDNMAFIGIGLPIGMAIGIGIGTTMDQKAAKENRQLAFKPGVTW